MLIQYTQACTYADDDRLDLQVTTTGDTVTVVAGSFRLAGVDYELVEAQTYQVTLDYPEYHTTITGYLVRAKVDGEIGLLVDEVPAIVGHPPYDFSDPESPYECLLQLYVLQVPAQTTDFTELPCLVYRQVAA